MNLPFRTRFSAHLVSAFSTTPMVVLHSVVVIAWIVLPLKVAIDDDFFGLLVLFWPLLAVWLMAWFAANAEVDALCEVHADAVARGDGDAAAAAIVLLRLLSADGRQRDPLRAALAIAFAREGRHEEAIPELERSLTRGSTARRHADCAYWLAMSYRATGREDDAREKLRVAAETESPFAENARALLAMATPFRG